MTLRIVEVSMSVKSVLPASDGAPTGATLAAVVRAHANLRGEHLEGPHIWRAYLAQRTPQRPQR